MIGKKLTQLLAALDPTEFRRMRKLFQSPLHTSNPHHLKLYDYIRKFYPTFDSPRLEKKNLFGKVYSEQTFDDRKLRILVTEFAQLVEDYFIMLDNRKNEFQRKRQLTKIYGERNLYDFFEKGTKRLLADLESQPYRDMSYHLNRAQLNAAWYFHPLKNKYDLKDDCLEDLMENMNRYLLLANRRIGITTKNVEQILAKKYDFRLLEMTEKEMKWLKHNYLIQLYQLTYKLVTEQKESDFEKIEALLFNEVDDEFDDLIFFDKQLFFINGLNFINRQLNIGKAKYSKKAFAWNEFGLKYGLFLENQRMNENIFGNIVLSACRVSEFSWGKIFIENYQNHLKPKRKTEIVAYHLGLIFYYQQDYDQSFIILSNFSFSPTYTLRSRIMIIRGTFELFIRDDSHFEILMTHIRAFEIFCLRNKNFTKIRLEPHLNFVRLLKKLTNKLWKRQNTKSIKVWLQQELSSKKKIGAKKWFAEKSKEL